MLSAAKPRDEIHSLDKSHISNLDDMVGILRKVIPDDLQHNKQTVEFLLVGGAAMFLHGLRSHVNDLDVYTPEKTVYCKWLLEGNVDIDMTTSNFVWGQIKYSHVKSKTLAFGAPDIKIHLIDLPTLFIMKADNARDKDMLDLPIFVQAIPNPIDIVKAAAALRADNDYGTWYLVVENLLAEIQAQYMMPMTMEMIANTGMEIGDMEMLAEAFGLDPDIKTNQNSKSRKGAAFS